MLYNDTHGATKLSLEHGEKFCMQVADWWLKCLEEITDHLPGARWHVHIDDEDIPWGEKKEE